MTVDNFNQLSLDEKFSFIRKSLKKRRCGFCNELTFADMSITFRFAQSGKPEYARAEPLPIEFIERTESALKRAGLLCTISIWDNMPEYIRHALMEKFIHSKN